MRLHTCRGCAYTSQCASMLKVAFCEQAYQQYQLGNPLAPNILANGFEGLERDQGRVADGKIRGDACNCEPELRPHRGPSGRAGMCSAAGELARGNFAELDGCADLCMSMARGQYFTYWKATGECITYSYCAWENCASDSCFYSATYRFASLGTYIDTRGQVQEFNVYPQRTVQSTPSDCQRCLHLYEEVHCTTLCGPARRVSYTHWPAGQLCATCIFAGNRLHELQDFQLSRVKACVYEAIRVSEDPWEYCNDTVRREAGVSTLDLFNGVSTHFLSECPGRPFAEAGAVCMPNLYAIRNFSLQVLSRQAAINDTVWSVDMECINAVCQMVPRSTCYYRLGEWSFTDGLGGLIRNQTQIGSYSFNSPDGNATGVQGGSLRLERSSRQYAHTEPVPLLLLVPLLVPLLNPHS